MVRCGLGGRVGGVRLVGRILAEEAFLAERAEDLVGGDVVEAEALLGLALEAAPVPQRLLQQREGANDIGLDEVARPVDRAVDMAFGGEMHDDVGPELGEERPHALAVADIGLLEAVAVAAQLRVERGEVAGIGQLVDDADLMLRLADQLAHHRRADKAGAAGHQKPQ